jgi:peptidoglycan/xylan/chitin deacetylase (PgdA/CDA1 family)
MRADTLRPVCCIILVRTLQVSVAALVVHVLFRWPLEGPHALGLFVTPLLCMYFVFVFVAPWTWGLPIRTHVPCTHRSVALTFDDGPSSETTPRILEALTEQQARATFFVLGENVRRHPDLMRRIVAAGHCVGIHGDMHEPFVLLNARRIAKEIAQTRDAIHRACPESRPAVWLRPPYGFKSLALLALSRRAGCRLAAWNVNALDYRTQDAQRIAGTVCTQARPGAIILLHDGAANTATADALPKILSSLAALGYDFVTL